MDQQFDLNNENDIQKLILIDKCIDDADEEFISILKCFINNSIFFNDLLSSKHRKVKKKKVGKLIRNV